MSLGEQARIYIKPNYGYGNRAMGMIPPNSILVFDVQFTKNFYTPLVYYFENYTKIHRKNTPKYTPIYTPKYTPKYTVKIHQSIHQNTPSRNQNFFFIKFNYFL
jgi:hypothetical protein